jgi:hypothetical protein
MGTTMTNQINTPDAAVENLSARSPFVLEFFMVEGVGFRCMAYCDKVGKWRNAFTNEELFGDIYIVE